MLYKPTFSAVILAGGKGERFGSSIPKPFMSLNGKPVIQYSLDVFEGLVDEIIIVSNRQYKDYRCVEAGKTRSESAFNGVSACSNPNFVIIHDGARPFIRKGLVELIKTQLLAGYDCVDTVSSIVDGYVENGISLSKTGKYLGLTPEGFYYKMLMLAFKGTDRRDWQDEVEMYQEVVGLQDCCIVGGEVFNSKITYKQDLAYAEGIMKFWNRPIDTKPDLGIPTLLFGGSGGIGKACVKKLKDVDCPTRREVDLREKLDVDLGKYRAIIHSAGEYFDEGQIMRVNFESCVELINLAEDQEWKGNIVFLSSTAATYGRKGIPIYSASKSALNAYIEARHEELAQKGIYINAIAPAKVDTRLQETINPDTPKSEMMTPEFVADYVLRYTDTKTHGHIIFLRKGFDE